LSDEPERIAAHNQAGQLHSKFGGSPIEDIMA
jgi:hypothetical protein